MDFIKKLALGTLRTGLKVLVKFDDIAQGWKRVMIIYGMFGTIIALAIISPDMGGIAQIIAAVGGVLGGLGVFISFAKVAKHRGIE